MQTHPIECTRVRPIPPPARAADPLAIRLLGGLSIRQGGEPITLPTRKCMGLLAILALRPGTPVTRERLAELLWSRSTVAHARASLRQALALLRRSLETDGAVLLESVDQGMRLRPECIATDAAELESALAEGSPESLARAAALYRGHLLEGFVLYEAPFDDWLAGEAQGLRARALPALTGLLDRQVRSGDLESALVLGERLLALDPAAEAVHRLLIGLDIERGALGSAIGRYERCRLTLAQGGVEPAAATQGLRQSIRVPPEPAGAAPLVAVLPFADRSPAATQGHLALGFAEELIHAMTRLRSLPIMAAQSSFALADADTDPRGQAARLGARYCLTGSLSADDETLHIAAELLDADSGRCLWSGRQDAPANGVFAAQDAIARSVAAALAAPGDCDLPQAPAPRPPQSLDAYDCWLRGVACLRQGTTDGMLDARPYFHLALDIDPGFARAYTGLALSHFNLWSSVAWERRDEHEQRAYDYALQGARLDDNDHLTQLVLGRILLYRRDFEGAQGHLARAESLNPNDADLLAQLAYCEACLGEAKRGMKHAELARRLNPFHDDRYLALAAGTALLAHRLPEAVELARRATGMHSCLTCALAHLGRIEEARHHRDRFLAIFQHRICGGRPPERDEPVRWLLQVNPIRRPVDQAFLLDGLRRAGLAVPGDLAAIH